MIKKRILSILNKCSSCLVGAVLFSVPFFWFSKNNIILGGETFTLANPDVIIGAVSYAWATYALGLPSVYVSSELYQFFNFLFFKLFSVAIIDKIIFGILLAGPFLSFHYLLRSLNHNFSKSVLVLGSLLYVFNPFYTTMFTWTPTYGMLFIVFPVLLVQVIEIFKHKFRKVAFLYLALASLLMSIIGANVALLGLIFGMILIYYLVSLSFDRKDFLPTSLKLILVYSLMVLMNLFWILPFSFLYGDLYGSANVYKGSFEGNAMFKAPILNGMTLSQYFYYDKRDGNGNLFYSFFDWYHNPSKIILVSAIILFIYWIYFKRGFWESKKEDGGKKIITFFLLLFLLGIFLSKGTADPLGSVYAFLLANFKLFGIYRSADIKFPLLVITGIAFLFAYGFWALESSLKNKNAIVGIKILSLGIVCFMGMPFFMNNIFNASTKIEIPSYWYEYSEKMEKSRIQGRTVLFPKNLSPFDSYVWGYEGAWLTAKLNENSSIGYSSGYGPSRQEANLVLVKPLYNFFEEKNVPAMISMSSLFNARSFIQRNDFSTYKESASADDSLSNFYTKDNIKNSFENSEKFEVYESIGELERYNLKNELFLPILYTPRKSIVSSRSLDNISKIVSSSEYDIRSAIFFRGQNIDKNKELLSWSNSGTASGKLPILEFKKINPIKYRIRMHGASGVFPVVFSESFQDNWRVYLSKKYSLGDASDISLTGYKILGGNESDQATQEELDGFVDNGHVTDLGDGNEKSIEHKKWLGGMRKTDYIEKYSIDFISKNFQGTIQNDNLPSGRLWETWFRNPIENNQNHLMVNGYANSWVLNVEKICGDAHCIRNADGTYDFEIVVEFWPQRLFYIGVFIAILMLLICLLYVFREKLCKKIYKPLNYYKSKCQSR